MTGRTEVPLRPVAPAGERPRPCYVRVLRLRYINPNGWLCFLFFEGMIALAALLALAEQASWWAVAVLPSAVAAMVKINDIVAGALAQPGDHTRRSASPRRTR